MASKQVPKKHRDYVKMLDKLYENAVEIAKGGKIGISLMSFSNSGFREWSTKNGSEKLLMTQKCKSCNDVTWHQSLKRDMLEITKNNDSIESNTNLVNLEFNNYSNKMLSWFLFRQ